jgi:3-oxoacyl-[acyl-carrier-protein] synthase III
MAGLTRIGMHVPEGRESVESVLTGLERPEGEIRLYRRLHNLQQVAVTEDGGLEQLLGHALADLAATEDLSAVGLVLYAHTILPQVPPDHDLLGRVLAPFGLEHLPCYGVAHLNCTSLFRATQLAQAYVEQFPDRAVLVLGGDHTTFMRQARILPGVSVTGDAAVAFLVRRDAYRYRWLGGAWKQETRFHRGFEMDREEAKVFTAVYGELLVGVIADCIAAAGLDLDEVDQILPHNVNETTWVRYSRETGYPKERIFLELIPEVGHTMTTDAFLNLETAVRRGRIAPGDRCVLVGVGTGTYFAAALVEIGEVAELADYARAA